MQDQFLEDCIDSQEHIQLCLKCTKDDCDNCVAYKLKAQAKGNIEWQGKLYNSYQLAEMAGYNYCTFRRRKEKYGLEFAMSDEKFYKTWKEKQENEQL